MKIAKIIKSSALIATLGFGTIFSASADDTKGLFSSHGDIQAAFIDGMASSLVETIGRNPPSAPQLNCVAAANYSAAINHLSATHYRNLLDSCNPVPDEEPTA